MWCLKRCQTWDVDRDERERWCSCVDSDKKNCSTKKYIEEWGLIAQTATDLSCQPVCRLMGSDGFVWAFARHYCQSQRDRLLWCFMKRHFILIRGKEGFFKNLWSPRNCSQTSAVVQIWLPISEQNSYWGPEKVIETTLDKYLQLHSIKWKYRSYIRSKLGF